ncbi:NUDIX hydrolase [Oceanobacillus salinisoli]|uniref:NUDIX hydrolase n=1 Tax=Oceanobacillus salinisoli TaxID=2678611 RepID=UPI0012E1148C|nr:8-oxo-dGTP diphosphatase [Oceanobacillus salinisoli]
MLEYTIGFIKRGNEILLLNREKSSWMGRWNGVGGKLEANETPTMCIQREIKEETGIVIHDAAYKGMVTWEVDSSHVGGMYAYIAEVPEDYTYHTPIKTDEGILDWKKIDWVLHPKNEGIANLKYYLTKMLEDDRMYEHRFVYQQGEVTEFHSIELEKKISSRTKLHAKNR